MTDRDFLKFIGIILILQGLSSFSTRVQLYRLENRVKKIEAVANQQRHVSTTNAVKRVTLDQQQNSR